MVSFSPPKNGLIELASKDLPLSGGTPSRNICGLFSCFTKSRLNANETMKCLLNLPRWFLVLGRLNAVLVPWGNWTCARNHTGSSDGLGKFGWTRRCSQSPLNIRPCLCSLRDTDWEGRSRQEERLPHSWEHWPWLFQNEKPELGKKARKNCNSWNILIDRVTYCHGSKTQFLVLVVAERTFRRWHYRNVVPTLGDLGHIRRIGMELGRALVRSSHWVDCWE